MSLGKVHCNRLSAGRELLESTNYTKRAAELSSQRPNTNFLKRKRFFIGEDVPNQVRKKLVHHLQAYGAKIEEFFDRSIDIMVVSSPNNYKQNEQVTVSSIATKSWSHSLVKKVISNSSPTKPIEKKTPKPITSLKTSTTKSPHQCKSSENNFVNSKPLNLASSFGVRIETVKTVSSWLKSNSTSHKNKVDKATLVKLDVDRIKLLHPCVKLDDGQRKPVYEQVVSVPIFNFSNFTQPTGIIYEDSDESHQQKSAAVKRKKAKRGYCERCEISFLCESKHLKSSSHISYNNEDSNFSHLVQFISNDGINFDRFLEGFKLDETEQDNSFNSETPTETSADIYFVPEATSPKSTSGSPYVNDEYISSILKHTRLDSLSCSDFTKANFIRTSGVFSQNSDKLIESQS